MTPLLCQAELSASRLNKEGGEKEEGEVGDHGDEGEGERFKFWVRVDLTRAADSP